MKRADAAGPRPFIINTAYTGAVSDKARNPAVPYAADEILADAAECAALGSAMGHFHIRTASGAATNDPNLYAVLFDHLRNDPRTRSMVLVASTSGRHGQTLAERAAVLTLPEDIRPDMASLTLSSLNFATGESVNRPDDIRALAETMLRHEVRPELEVFDLGMAAFARKLIAEGLLEPPFYFNVILGNVAGAQADLVSAGAILSTLPPESVVSLGGIARAQISAHLFALAGTDGLRTGLEDNLRMPGGGEPASNPALVRRARDLARLSGRSIETPEGLRSRLRLKSR